jgi:2,3-dihydroxy-2,3-dihydrophenylpropionate dehydrogenase
MAGLPTDPPSAATRAALEGEVALITGGGSGIGRAVVDRYVAEGARVGVLDTRDDRLAEVAAAYGDRVLTIAGSVADATDNDAAVRQTVERFGRLDVFVGNAGVTDGFQDFVDLDTTTIDAGFDELFAVNVKGYLLGAKAALPALLTSRGCMIFTLSAASHYPNAGGVLYVASKHAGLGIVRELAHELAPAIRVNGVAAGPTRTDLRMPGALDPSQGSGNALDAQPADPENAIRACTPLDHWAEASEHAGAYVLLASRTEGALITGETIRTDLGLGVRGLVRTRGGDALLTSPG